jgi:hypothetical protein
MNFMNLVAIAIIPLCIGMIMLMIGISYELYNITAVSAYVAVSGLFFDIFYCFYKAFTS